MLYYLDHYKRIKKKREFFTDKVLGSKNYKGTTKEDFQNVTASQQESIYGDYMKGRQGRTDAYGNEISQMIVQGSKN